MQAAQLGNAQAFEEIVRLHQRDVRSFVRKYLGPHSAADDVAQDVFVQVYRSIKNYSGEGSLKAWIFGIARNRIRTLFRQRSNQLREQQLDLAAELAEWRLEQSEDDALTETLESEKRALQQCLRRLAARHRELIQQFYFQGVAAESIAERQGKKAGAVRMSLLRIRNALGKCIRQERSSD